MPPLADRPEIIGFFSYSRDDDRDSEGSLSLLRRRIQNELRGLLGRSETTLRLFQDAEAIPSGTFWEKEIGTAIEQSVFFVPIVTPRVVRSEHCRDEFRRFLDRERALGRNDLMFPIVYIEVNELRDERTWRGHPVLEHIGARQYVDWCDYRFEPDSPVFRRAIAAFCRTIATALRRESERVGVAAPSGSGAEAFLEESIVSSDSTRVGKEGARPLSIERPPSSSTTAPPESDQEQAVPQRSRDVAVERPGGPERRPDDVPPLQASTTQAVAATSPPASQDQSASQAIVSSPHQAAARLATETRTRSSDRDPRGQDTAPDTGPDQTATVPISPVRYRFLSIFNVNRSISFAISAMQTAIFIAFILANSPRSDVFSILLFTSQLIMYIVMYLLLKSSISWKRLIYIIYSLLCFAPSVFLLWIISNQINHISFNFRSVLIVTGGLTYTYCGLWGMASALRSNF